MVDRPSDKPDSLPVQEVSAMALHDYRAGKIKPPGKWDANEKAWVITYSFDSKKTNAAGQPGALINVTPMTMEGASPEERAKMDAAQKSAQRAFAKISRATKIKFIPAPPGQADNADLRLFTVELTQAEKEAIIRGDETLSEVQKTALLTQGVDIAHGFTDNRFAQKDILITKGLMSADVFSTERDSAMEHEIGHALCLDDILGVTQFSSIMASAGKSGQGFRPADYISLQEVYGMSDELKKVPATVTLEDLQNNRPLYSPDGKVNFEFKSNEYQSLNIEPGASGWDQVHGWVNNQPVGGTLFPGMKIGNIDASSSKVSLTAHTEDKPFDMFRPSKISAGKSVDKIYLEGNANTEIRGGECNDTFVLTSGTHHHIADFTLEGQIPSRPREHDNLILPQTTTSVALYPTKDNKGVLVAATDEAGQVARVELRSGDKPLTPQTIRDMIASETANPSVSITINDPKSGLPVKTAAPRQPGGPAKTGR